jgi:hypothetical protein
MAGKHDYVRLRSGLRRLAAEVAPWRVQPGPEVAPVGDPLGCLDNAGQHRPAQQHPHLLCLVLGQLEDVKRTAAQS